MRTLRTGIAMMAVWASTCLPVLAQEGIAPYLEYAKRIEAARRLSALETGLFGEQVSLYSGGTEFSVTDIDIPGNNALPVRLSRRLPVELQPQTNAAGHYDALLRGVGNWDVEVPHLAATYPLVFGNALRCDGEFVPIWWKVPFEFEVSDVWQGIAVHVPGRTNTSALGMLAPVPRPSGGGPYPLTTAERDVFECIPMRAGVSGQGFRMTTAAGLRYDFDVATSRTASSLRRSVNPPHGGILATLASSVRTVARQRLYLLASRVEDRFGNSVQFQYNANGHPTRIWANDGREIVLSYSNGRLNTASSHGRTWQYQYSHLGNGLSARLSKVIQPDGSQWNYAYTHDLMPPPSDSEMPSVPWCKGEPIKLAVSWTMTATHPSGAVGTFHFSNLRHYRSGVHASSCKRSGDLSNPDYQLLAPYFFDVMSLTGKTITGPGLSAMTWSYLYGIHPQNLWGSPTGLATYPCTSCKADKTVTVTNPDGTRTRHTFGMRYHDNDGRALKVETLTPNDIVIRTETNTWMGEAQTAGQPFHAVYGMLLNTFIADPASVRVRPLVQRTIRQNSVDFIWQATAFDSFARARAVTRSSTLDGHPARSEAIVYWDHLSKWVLGQVASVTCTAPTTPLPGGCGSSGTQLFQRTYDPVWAVPLATSRFGKLEQTLAWNTTSTLASGQRGTITSVADGNGHLTKLSNWKRGTPQTIRHPGTPEVPSGATRSAQVNNHGWLDWIQDENGHRTHYTWDALGRLASVAYPASDSTAWNTTTQVFEQVNSAEYGIAAKHWRQTVSTGNARAITYYDALWRPLLTREYDTSQVNATQRFQRFAYDLAGRIEFTSYPSAVHTPAQGIWMEYDALGRTRAVRQDSELGPNPLLTLTEYLGGFRTRITSPRGAQTTTRYWALDQPTQEYPVAIAHPAGAHTHITRDIFGKPTILRRSNSASPSGGTLAVERTYHYNAAQELCRTVEPETGATLMGYDGAGNLLWSAAGLPAGTACHPTGTTATILPRKVTRAYDARNRLLSLDFPAADPRGSQTWSYTPDGLPATITTVNATDGGALVSNAYSYNKRRLLTSESIQRGGSAASTISYAYTANGHLSGLTYPAPGPVLDYAPNALGQPTQAGAFASAVSYFPNGMVKRFTYGNGIVHTQTQTTRGLPARRTDCTTSGASCAEANRRLDLDYSYDSHGNTFGITDHSPGGRHTRQMSYDNRDRLLYVTSPATVFGIASYTYDVLDNLTSVKLSGGSHARDHSYQYDPASARLSEVRKTIGGALVMALEHDVQGNLSGKGAPGNLQAYQFDFGNRLRSVPGLEGSYEYDGHGRRVVALATNGLAIESQYASSGNLLRQRNHRTNREIDYVYLGQTLIASQERLIGGSVNTARYQHTDALGTPLVVTGGNKAVVENSTYEPYGQLINTTPFDGPGYTGHVQDAITGLTYMQQRYYDPQLGIFLSVDPVTAYTDPVGQFHRYRYANGNPYTFIDLDGREKTCMNGHCIITANMHNPDNSNGQTTLASSELRAAANQVAHRFRVRSGEQESLGFFTLGSDGNIKAEHAQGVTHSSSETGVSVSAAVPEGAIGVIHGHIENGSHAADGMVDDPNRKNPYGDANPLRIGLPNATVFREQVGWHEINEGRLQFSYPEGAMNGRQEHKIQSNLDKVQKYFDIEK